MGNFTVRPGLGADLAPAGPYFSNQENFVEMLRQCRNNTKQSFNGQCGCYKRSIKATRSCLWQAGN